MVIPIGMSLYYSFTKYSVLGSPSWIGFDNYTRMFGDSNFRHALLITLIYTIFAVPLQSMFALVIANTVARSFNNPYGYIVRSALFVPVVSSFVVAALVWRAIFGTRGGMINSVLSWFGISNINFLGEPTWAFVAIIVVTVWKNIGYFLVIYYAGVLEIPKEHYEAASLDGASSRKQFWYITVPSLRPIHFLVVILGTIWSFQVFDLVYVMTGGGPGNATTTLVMEIYRVGFQNFQMGYASAIAIVLFVLVLLFAVIQRRVLDNEK